MGTRSTIHVFIDGKNILNLFGMFDGYPEGVGKELAEFALSRRWTNGFSLGEKRGGVFNGMAPFAVELVRHLAAGDGSWYATSLDDRQEYRYEIHGEWDGAQDVLTRMAVDHGGDPLYNGPVEGFAAWLATPREEEE